MFLYKNLYTDTNGQWSGSAISSPFFSNLFMPFNGADRLEISDLALNNLLIQRDDVSIYGAADGSLKQKIFPNPGNLTHLTDTSRNAFTEYNCSFDGQSAEGGDISFDGEAIEAVVVRRSSNRSNYFIWEDIAVIPITTNSLYTLDNTIYDPYIEHGIEYQYAIQPVGRLGRGAQYETLRYKADYDDIWLIGSDVQQLVMAYNAVVSGYKYIVKDAAIETIGSKYPYVVRNANVGYTQFQFSCTLTAHMNVINDKEVFTPFKDIQILDEYKGIIPDDGSTGESSTGSGEFDEWLPPVLETVYLMTRPINELPESGAPIISDTGKTIIMATPNTRYEMLSKEEGSYVKIKVPLDGISNPQQFWPVGFNSSNPWTESYLIGYIKEIYALPIEEPDREPLTPGEIEFRISNPGMEPAELKRQVQIKKLIARQQSDISGQTSGTLTEGGATVDPDREYTLEREFRRRVMDFIYDGKPKIFKSPTEGLMLVKLTDISLTPNTALGRMIYDFSCTMTEIGKIDSSSLAKYGFRSSLGDIPVVGLPEDTDNSQMGQEEALALYEQFKFK